MTQRIFDVENEQDMQDLWSILPDDVVRIKPVMGNATHNATHIEFEKDFINTFFNTILFNINWHDKTEITRPMQEATEKDIGKLCVFWNGVYEKEDFGILAEICGVEKLCRLDNKLAEGVDGVELWYKHARRLTKQEIEELI